MIAFLVSDKASYITGAVENELYAVFVRFNAVAGSRGVGAVIVERGAAGFTMEAGPEFLGARGLPHGNQADLVEALFSVGLSTTDRATELSGRGVGMSALSPLTIVLISRKAY